MPTYQIEFVGGNRPSRQPMTIHCVDDAQAMSWASSFLGNHLAAEVSEGARKVGWATFPDDQV
jgi:hypothetical protein